MTEARLRLDDQLCFALYAATNAITRAYRPLLRELGITSPQYLTLMALWQHSTGTVGELAQRLDLPAHSMTPLLQRLEQAGLIVRRRSPIDSRAVLVELTSVGGELERSAATVQRTVECATGRPPTLSLPCAASCTTWSTTCAQLPQALIRWKEKHHDLERADTRRLAPEADPATAPQVHASDATLYERLGGCYGIAGAVDVLVDRLFKNVKVNANDKVHEHHGNPANAAGYKFLVTSWSIEATGGPKCYIGHDMTVAHEHLSIDKDGFDAVYMEIEATLFYLGAPAQEINEFMNIIESFRSDVVA